LEGRTKEGNEVANGGKISGKKKKKNEKHTRIKTKKVGFHRGILEGGGKRLVGKCYGQKKKEERWGSDRFKEKKDKVNAVSRGSIYPGKNRKKKSPSKVNYDMCHLGGETGV